MPNSCQIRFKWGEKWKACLCKQKATISLNTLASMRSVETFLLLFFCVAGTKVGVKQWKALLSTLPQQSNSTSTATSIAPPQEGPRGVQKQQAAAMVFYTQRKIGAFAQRLVKVWLPSWQANPQKQGDNLSPGDELGFQPPSYNQAGRMWELKETNSPKGSRLCPSRFWGGGGYSTYLIQMIER